MRNLLAASPWLVYLLASWLLSGTALVRGVLGLRRGVEVAALALPIGLLAQILGLNLLAHLLPVAVSVHVTVAGALLAALAWWAIAGRRQALEWEGRQASVALLAVALFTCAGSLALGLQEIFPDDGPHASMAQLLAAGFFPLRFPCNPDLRLAYHYGADLLAAVVLVVARTSDWEALDVVRALIAASVALLAFLAGWRVRGSVRAGVLSALLLLLAGQATWLCAPLLHEPLSGWARSLPPLAPLVERLETLTLVTPYGLLAPSKTPMFAHAHRSLAWGFGPFQILLFLALHEARLERRRKTVALALVLGATALLQTGALVILVPGLGLYGAWTGWRAWRSRRARNAPAGDFSVAAVAALGLGLLLVQGGPLTDALLDGASGAAREVVAFRAAPLQLPGARGAPPSFGNLLFAVVNVGLAPFLLPWVAWRAWRDGAGARLLLAACCAFAGTFQFFVRYPYSDAAVVRTLTFAIWTIAALLGPLLESALRAAGARRLVAAAAVVVLLTSGAGFLAMYPVVPLRDPLIRSTPRLFRIGALDETLRPLAARLPREAVIFDPSGCPGALGARPCIVFGRYAAVAGARNIAPPVLPGFAAALADPDPEVLRRHGYTHIYADAAWQAAEPAVRARLDGGAFALLGCASDGTDFRALLRVCAPNEQCALRLAPGLCRVP